MSPAKLPATVDAAIQALEWQNLSVAQITAAVPDLLKNGEKPPSERTVRRRVSELKADGNPWTIAAAPDGASARLVLEVLDVVIERTEGRRQVLIEDEAGWIIKLRQAAPTLPPWQSYRLARFFMQRIKDGESTKDLDAYVAGGAWGNEERSIRYDAMLVAGWVPEPPYPVRHEDLPMDLNEYRDSTVPMIVGDLRAHFSEQELPAARLNEIAQATVIKRFGELPTSRGGALKLFEGVAKSLRRPPGLLALAEEHVRQHPEVIEDSMEEAGLSRLAADKYEQVKFISKFEKSRREMADKWLPLNVRPYIEFDDDFIVFEGGVTTIDDVLARAKEAG